MVWEMQNGTASLEDSFFPIGFELIFDLEPLSLTIYNN